MLILVKCPTPPFRPNCKGANRNGEGKVATKSQFIGVSLRRRSVAGTLITIIFIALCLGLPSQPIVAIALGDSQSSDFNQSELTIEEMAKLDWLESHFFGRTYAKDSLSLRVLRLENFVFGVPAAGPYSLRLTKLEASANTVDPDGKKHQLPLMPKAAKSAVDSDGGDGVVLPQTANAYLPTPAENGGQSLGYIRQFYKAGGMLIDAANGKSADIGDVPPNVVAKPNSDQLSIAAAAPISPGESTPIILQVTRQSFMTDGLPIRLLRELDLAIKLHPLDPDLLYERAKALIQLDRINRAVADLSDAIMNNPNDSQYYLARAWCYRQLGNSVLAADDLKQARFVNPNLPDQVNISTVGR